MGPAGMDGPGAGRGWIRLSSVALTVALVVTLIPGSMVAKPKDKGARDVQSIEFTLAPTGTVGEVLELQATASSGLPIEYSTKPTGRCEVDDGQLLLLAAGTCRVTATQIGDDQHARVKMSASLRIEVPVEADTPVDQPKVHDEQAAKAKGDEKAKTQKEAKKAKRAKPTATRGRDSKPKQADSAAEGQPAPEPQTEEPSKADPVEETTPALELASVEPAATLSVLSVTDDGQLEGDPGDSERLVFYGSLSPAASTDVEFATRTRDGTAIAGEDYVSATDTITIPAGSTLSDPFYVDIIGDTLGELDETLEVVVTTVIGATGAGTVGSGVILDDDPPTLTVLAPDIEEGSGDEHFAFALNLSKPSASPVVVGYTTFDFPAAVDAAGAGVDYETATGSVTFTAGMSAQQVWVTILGDEVIEVAERFGFRITSVTGASYSGSDTVAYIENDDWPGISIADSGAGEAATNVIFEVSLDEAGLQPVSVDYATSDGTATTGSDFESTSGTLTFQPGQTLQSVAVPIIEDWIDEYDEAFSVVLMNPVNGDLVDSHANGGINDDDAPPQLSIRDSEDHEGDSGTTTLSFTAVVSSPSGKNVTFDYTTADGTATADTDYVSATDTATVPAGRSSTTVEVDVIGDEEIEPTEEFEVVITSVTNATTGIHSSGTGTILADDGPVISVSGTSVNEGDGSAVFEVSLDTSSAGQVTVHFVTSDQMAVAGSDYIHISGDLVFAPGQTLKTVAVALIDDAVGEFDEGFALALSNPVGGYIGEAYATATIVDDDPPPDTTPPTVTAPHIDIARGATVNRASPHIPLKVAFTATDPSGIADTVLQHQVDGGSWSDVALASPTAQQVTTRVTKNGAYAHGYRSQATDGAAPANVSPFATGAPFKVKQFQDGSSAVGRKGTWARKRSSSFFGGTVRAASRSGAKIKVTAIGTDFAIVSTKGRDRGKAKVLIDGKGVAVIDLYAWKTKPRSIVFSKSFATEGKHTITLKVLGQKNPKSRGTRVDLDAFVVLRGA